MPGAGTPKVEGIGAKNQNTELLHLPHFIIQLRNRRLHSKQHSTKSKTVRQTPVSTEASEDLNVQERLSSPKA